MACSNCFNGCTEIISDQCVKYTGVNIPALNITTGETLSSVESKITAFILNLSTGEGIIPVIESGDLCSIVSGFLPGSGEINLNDVLSALIQSACSLKTSVDSVTSSINVLNADYTTICLSGVTASSDTHDVLQAAITKLCATDSALSAFITNVTTNYVTIASLNTRIQEYIDSSSYTPPVTIFQKSKMVPYVAYEYYPLGGSLSNFDANGKGIDGTQWDRVFLCNGYNGTPDKRGRVAVGATTGMLGGAMNPNVDPSVGANPNYILGGTTGQNNITLTENQLPSHTHIATATSTSVPHTHAIARNANQDGDLTAGSTLDSRWDAGNDDGYTLKKTISGVPDLGITSSTTVTVNTLVTVGDTGTGQSHSNFQPGIGAYYIMYIP
jgi:microcystin-dependent protein